MRLGTWNLEPETNFCGVAQVGKSVRLINERVRVRIPPPRPNLRGYDLKAMMPALQAGCRGSNPLSSTKLRRSSIGSKSVRLVNEKMRVRLSPPQPAFAVPSFKFQVPSSDSERCFTWNLKLETWNYFFCGVAKLVRHRIVNPAIEGSNPSATANSIVQSPKSNVQSPRRWTLDVELWTGFRGVA